MKRVGNLIGSIAEPENLRLAFWRAARGRRSAPEVRDFAARLDEEIRRLHEGILAGDYPIGRFVRFVVRDPKERVVHAPSFPERVLHHAFMNVCEPHFERWAVCDTYACRRGKGQWAAVRRAEQFASEFPFFLKMDIRKYFDSIRHDRLLELLARRFKDGELLAWFARFLGSYETAPGHGLPIGSLLSQHLANFNLGPLDRLVKETLRCRSYVRYMDDSVVWGSSVRDLQSVLVSIDSFVSSNLGLCLKASPFINRANQGMDFLGCRVHPGYSVLNRRSRRRFCSKLRACHKRLALGIWTEREVQRHAEALVAFTRQVKAWQFRRRVLEDLGQWPEGLVSRDPRRQLEQRRPELPVGEPEQQQPVQQQQQQRIPRRPSSDQSRTAQGTEPATVLSAGASSIGGKCETRPPGAGRPSGGGSKAPGGLTRWESNR